MLATAVGCSLEMALQKVWLRVLNTSETKISAFMSLWNQKPLAAQDSQKELEKANT